MPHHICSRYHQHAVRALRMNALDYLEKPVDVDDLVNAVARVSTASKRPFQHEQITSVQAQLNGATAKKVAVHTLSGVVFVTLEDILFAEASNNYTKLILVGAPQLVLSKTLKDVQEVLEHSHFLRVHRQFIINTHHVKAFNRNDSVLTMVDNTDIPVARAQKDRLMAQYGWL